MRLGVFFPVANGFSPHKRLSLPEALLILSYKSDHYYRIISVLFMCRLRVFKIFISPPIATWRDRSLRISLIYHATLEHLELGIQFEGNDYFSYPAFSRKLRKDGFWNHLGVVQQKL